jgi:hypothetical protein
MSFFTNEIGFLPKLPVFEFGIILGYFEENKK